MNTRHERIRVVHALTNLHVGGTERQAVALSCGLDPQFFDVRLACLSRSGQLADEVVRRGIPLETYPVHRLYGPASVVQRLRLARYLRRERIDVVQSYGFYANLFATPAARLARVPVVLGSVRDVGDLLWTSRQRLAQRWASRLCDRVIVNAHAVARRCIELGYDPWKILVIPNGTDLARFEPQAEGWRERNGIAPHAALVTVLARLVLAHGVDFNGISDFLAAARLVAQRFDHARFLIVGDGSNRAALEARARELGLGERAVFVGFRQDVPEILAHSALLVQPSLTEAMSNSIQEAMAAGRPVVATDVGGNPELVEDGRTGLLVPSRNPVALAQAIEKLLADPELRERMGRAARRRVAERFSLERSIETFETLYASLLVERIPRRAAWTATTIGRTADLG
jgi:L-malate glycosyltransferase